MYENDPIFKEPDDPNVKIWRYIDLAKFLSLLDKNALFFSRCDLLGDPFEGSIPSTKGQTNLTDLVRLHIAERFEVPATQVAPPHSIHDTIRKLSFVCSFHMNNYESAALWSIYTKAKQGVAIQSTFSKLCDSFKNSSEIIRIGEMNYIDYSTEIIPVNESSFLPLLHKRKSFEHECELRAIVTMPFEIFSEQSHAKLDQLPRGLNIKVDLDLLIERIYIAPTTDEWIIDLIRSISKKYGLDKPIEQSILDESPII